jgi:hypothetical protein
MSEDRRRSAQKLLDQAMAARQQRRADDAVREAALRRTEAEGEAAGQRIAAERQAHAGNERREIDEIDRRLERRARRVQAAPTAAPAGVRPKARLRVAATALVDHEGRTLPLPLIDCSLTGALLATQGRDASQMRVGSRLALTVVANHDAAQQVDLISRVVRLDEARIAVDWSSDEGSAYRVGRLLDALSAAMDDLPVAEQRERELAEIDRRLDQLGAVEQSGPAPAALPPAQPRKARLQLSASVLVDHSGKAELLPLLNVSRTGGLILTQDSVLGRLRVGSLLLLSLISDDESRRVDLMAWVVRHDVDSTAVDWSEDHLAAYDIAILLDELAAAEYGDLSKST